MAYPYNYGYNPYPTYPTQQVQPQAQPQPTQPAYTQQIQNGGFIPAPNEMYARNYPVAPGNSVTFKDENIPYVYVKTMGFSQLDRPIFDKYRLVKEEEPVQNANFAPTGSEMPQGNINVQYALKTDVDEIKRIVDDLKADFENISSKKTIAKAKKEETEDKE